MWKNQSPSTKNFVLSFSLTLILIFSILAMLITDYRCSYIAKGVSTPIVEIYSENDTMFASINTLGISKQLDLTGTIKAWDFFMEFICLKA
ncbi:MAG: hypothetical protein R3Y35_05385 [Clostridia bacterium]